MEQQQRTEAWFLARKGRVTGSVCGAILGFNPYMTQEDVMRQLVRDWHGAPREFNGNIATRYGTENEAGAVIDMSLSQGVEFEECGFFAFEDWLGASPDGINDDAVLEVKCPFSQRDKKPPTFKSATEQPHYYAQMQIEMHCASRRKCYFYQWSPNGEAMEIVERNETWLDENLPKLRDFYLKFLVEREQPAAKKYLENREEIDAADLLGRYDELENEIKAANSEKAEIMAQLVEIADNKNAIINGRKLTNVERKGSVNYAKLVKECLPDVDVEPFRGAATSYWRLSK